MGKLLQPGCCHFPGFLHPLFNMNIVASDIAYSRGTGEWEIKLVLIDHELINTLYELREFKTLSLNIKVVFGGTLNMVKECP